MRSIRSRWPECVVQLANAGFTTDDAYALRRISMTLHRWHELECGDSNDYASWCITRGKHPGRGTVAKTMVFEHDENGAPYLERHFHNANKPSYTRIPDRERGALKRLDAIIARYPGFEYYVQGDPRGCALYILRSGDVPDGSDAFSCYTRGLAVYK